MVRSYDIFPDIFHARKAEMRPAVLRYAENIHTQCVQIIADLGFTSQEELEAAIEADPLHYAESPLREQITHLLELLEAMHAIFENPKGYETPTEREFKEKEIELKRILGEDYVISFDAIERAFTLKNGNNALEISQEERDTAMQQLLDKLKEPDIAQFLERLDADPNEAAKWMLVYRTSAQMTDQEGRVHPVSILGLRDVLDTDARQGENPTKLVYDFDEQIPWFVTDKKQGDADTWASRPVRSGWMFVTRAVVEGTMAEGLKIIEEYPDQTRALKKKAKKLGFADGSFRRRTPGEVVYDTLAMMRANGIFLLENECDCTGQESSLEDIVYVGSTYSLGVIVGGERDSDDLDTSYGACLSR